MFKAKCFALLFFTASALLVGDGEAETQVGNQTPRVIETVPGTSIAALLRPSDTFVIVRRGNVISSFADTSVPILEEDLDRRVRDADGIAVVELDKSESTLVENGSWITSKLTLNAIQIIKESTSSLFDSDGKVTVDHGGGEITINHVRVRAGRYPEFLPHERYLVFVRSRASKQVGFVGMQLKLTKDQQLGPIDFSDGRLATAQSSLYGLPLQAVILEVQQRLKQ